MCKPILRLTVDLTGNNHAEAREMARPGGFTSSSSARTHGTGNAYNNKTPIAPIIGPPIPLAMLPPPHTWPLFCAAPTNNGRIMARNISGSGRQY